MDVFSAALSLPCLCAVYCVLCEYSLLLLCLDSACCLLTFCHCFTRLTPLTFISVACSPFSSSASHKQLANTALCTHFAR